MAEWTALSCFFLLIFMLAGTYSAVSDVSRCPSKLPRTTYLRASDWEKCYVFHSEERTWRSANYICAINGGHLVTIKEERVQRFLTTTLYGLRWPRNGIWIGATDKDKEMDWRWLSGERVRDGYSNWASGQPSCGFFCIEDCALMRWKEGGQWHDFHCSWLENYSFICEYDMIPKPKTTSRTTTTTSTTLLTSTSTKASTQPEFVATKDIIIKNATSVLLDASSLETDYILQSHQKNESKQNNKVQEGDNNNTKDKEPPQVFLNGRDGAKAEQVQDIDSSQAGLGTGAVAFIIIAIFAVVVVGVCFVVIFMRRGRRKFFFCENNKGISYGNPYYESPTADKKGAGSFGNNAGNVGETDDEDSFACGDCQGAAFGLSVCASSNKSQERKQPLPNPHQSRVMNDYEASITFKPSTTKIYKGGHSHVEKKTTPKENPERHTFLLSKEAAVFYDELQTSYTNSELGYDIPRPSTEPWYRNNYTDNNAVSPLEEDMYYNNHAENIYESLENLAGQHTQIEETEVYIARADEEDRYVPFLLDGPKAASEKL